MLDIKLIRENLDQVKESLIRRNADYSNDLDKVLSLDTKRRDLLGDVEAMKNSKNIKSKEIPVLMKEKKDVSAALKELKDLSDKIDSLDDEALKVTNEIREILLNIPNCPMDDVPSGKDDTFNKEIRKVGDVRDFKFEPKAHWDIGEINDNLDFVRATKLSGARFSLSKNKGAKLERALINFMLDVHTNEHGYEEIMPPLLVSSKTMTGTGQLPKFKEDMFKIDDKDLYLIPTAEVSLTNMYADEILDMSKLPIYHTAYTPCFRKEAGSAGRDTRGLIRLHQFNKVELVKFTLPEKSEEELELLLNNAEKILKLLEIPYRVVLLASGDLGFSAAKTYDIEVYMPSYKRYVEISSCSNFLDYQARRANIRFKRSIDAKPEFVHTLNGSGLAIGRTVAAILENYQEEDGSYRIPKVLDKYLV